MTTKQTTNEQIDEELTDRVNDHYLEIIVEKEARLRDMDRTMKKHTTIMVYGNLVILCFVLFAPPDFTYYSFFAVISIIWNETNARWMKKSIKRTIQL